MLYTTVPYQSSLYREEPILYRIYRATPQSHIIVKLQDIRYIFPIFRSSAFFNKCSNEVLMIARDTCYKYASPPQVNKPPTLLQDHLSIWMPITDTKRFEEDGKDSLVGLSRRTKHLAKLKVNEKLVALIKSIRTEYKFGPQSISTHLLRKHGIELSDSSIWRVLKAEGIPNIKIYREKDNTIRFSTTSRGKGCKWTL
jgi:hypothetical protein